MTFWILSGLIALATAIFVAWPMLQGSASLRNYGLALAVLIPLAAIGLYRQVGTPQGIDVTGTPGQVQMGSANHPGGVGSEIDGMVASLERRLRETPEDFEGWMLLGRTYKTMERFTEAEQALARAAELAPEDALVLVEWAEARLFTSASPTASAEIRGILERVLELDPNQQKGLWLSGLVAAQDGDDARALAHWQRLANQLEPGSPILASLEQQMSQLRQRSGSAPTEPEHTAEPESVVKADQAKRMDPGDEPGDEPQPAKQQWKGLRVDVQAPDGLGELPPSAALFVIVRNPAVPGPPLGVARMTRPAFPAIAFISDANSMMENMPISAVGEVELVARLSMSGSPAAQPGDLESAPLRVTLPDTKKIELVLAPR